MPALALTTMKADPTAATRALLALAQQEWEADRARADERRRQAVLVASEAGLSDTLIAGAMRLSRQRVSQIRADTPTNG